MIISENYTSPWKTQLKRTTEYEKEHKVNTIQTKITREQLYSEVYFFIAKFTWSQYCGFCYQFSIDECTAVLARNYLHHTCNKQGNSTNVNHGSIFIVLLLWLLLTMSTMLPASEHQKLIWCVLRNGWTLSFNLKGNRISTYLITAIVFQLATKSREFRTTRRS